MKLGNIQTSGAKFMMFGLLIISLAFSSKESDRKEDYGELHRGFFKQKQQKEHAQQQQKHKDSTKINKHSSGDPSLSKTLTVTGRVGRNSGMNGVYHRGDDKHCNRVIYQQEKTDKTHWTIRWCPEHSYWLVGFRGLGPGADCAMLDDNVHPLLSSKTWKVWDGKRIEEDPNVKLEEWQGIVRWRIKMMAMGVKSIVRVIVTVMSEFIKMVQAMGVKDVVVYVILGSIILRCAIVPLITSIFWIISGMFWSFFAFQFKEFGQLLMLVIRLFWMNIYQYFIGKKLQQRYKLREWSSDFIKNFSYFTVVFVVERLTVANSFYSAFLSVVALALVQLISSSLSKILELTTPLSSGYRECARILSFIVLLDYVTSDQLDYLWFWKTHKDIDFYQLEGIEASEKCMKACNLHDDGIKFENKNPLIKRFCGKKLSIEPCSAESFLKSKRVLNDPFHSDFSEYSMLPKGTCNMDVNFKAKATGSIYSERDCKDFYKKCAKKNHPDKVCKKVPQDTKQMCKEKADEIFIKGCGVIEKQCSFLAKSQNSWLIIFLHKFQIFVAYILAFIFGVPQKDRLLLGTK